MRLETLAIGDELLTGIISDTNSTFVAQRLFENGMRLDRQTVVADDEPIMQATLRECGARADFVVCFGGLGPTSDDKTAHCLAELLGCELATHEPSKEKLLRTLKARGREVTPQGLKQVVYPKAAVPIDNPEGAAVGFTCRIGSARVFFLPGVPQEMKAMFDASVLPEIQKAEGGALLRHHSWRLLNIPESEVQRLMDPVEAQLPHGAYLGYRTSFPENHLTLYYRGTDDATYTAWQSDIRARVAPWCYGEGKKDMEQVVLDRLEARNLQLAVAESCTGGLVAHRLTLLPGSSRHFWGGTTVYQMGAKDRLLGVKLRSPEEAVSRGCTRQLAEALKAVSGCDIAAAITGYMGPTGGTKDDPQGTIYVCVLGPKVVEERIVLPFRERKRAQWGASTYLLNAIRLTLENQD